MKSLIAVLILTMALPLRAHDILSNGDFSQGTSNWNGDGQALSPGAADPSLPNFNAPAATGMVIALQPDKWTSISQDIFLEGVGPLWLKMKYTTSADFAPTPFDKYDMQDSVSQLLGFTPKDFLPESDIEKKYPATPWPNTFGVAVIVDATNQLASVSPLRPPPMPGQPITQVHNPNGEGGARTFYLIFPPGKGSITLTNVAVVSQLYKTGLPGPDQQ